MLLANMLMAAAAMAGGDGVPVARKVALTDVPFWQAMAGWWRSDNTYMNGALDYNVRAYNSLVQIELQGIRYRETEYKFYPPSPLALRAGLGKISAAEGIEVVTILQGELTDERGTVKLQGADQTFMQVLNKDTATRVTPNRKTGVDTYRMFIFTPSPNKRYRSNFGIVSDTEGAGAANALPGAKFGDLRGFSLFREDRITAAEVAALRKEYRSKNMVKALAETGADGQVTVRRLE